MPHAAVTTRTLLLSLTDHKVIMRSHRPHTSAVPASGAQDARGALDHSSQKL